VQILNEARGLAVAGDAQCPGHDLADDTGDVIAVFVVRHPIRGRAVLNQVIDNRSGRLEIPLAGFTDRNAELVFDGGEEFVECPAHTAPTRSVGIMINCNVVALVPTSNSCRGACDRAVLPSDMASIRKPASAPPPSSGSATGELPLGSAADAPHGSRPEQVYTRLRDLIVQGLLSPGSRIVETEIATRLGVSRTPVREALQRNQQRVHGHIAVETPVFRKWNNRRRRRRAGDLMRRRLGEERRGEREQEGECE